MQKEEKTLAQTSAEAKVEKIQKLLQELQVTLKAVLVPSESSLSATIVFKDNEKYPEEPKIEETIKEKSTDIVTA